MTKLRYSYYSTILFLNCSILFSHAPKITILTQSLLNNAGCGHKEVVRSILQGLSELNVSFNFNPKSEQEIARTVVVLASPQALSEMVQLKKEKKIDYLLGGPNLVVRPIEHGGILLSPEVDICLVPSDWVRVAYEEDGPSLRGRIRCFFSGVDTDYWQPANLNLQNKSKKVLIYWKTEPLEFVKKVELTLKNYGWDPTIVQYGSYVSAAFKKMLDCCALAIFISRTESQGLALAEAWSMNVSTLVWTANERTFSGKHYTYISPAPYLSDATGKNWRTLKDLELILQQIGNHQLSFNPRDWILQNMTDKHSAACLLEIINNLTTKIQE